jgi:hypothetical protein
MLDFFNLFGLRLSYARRFDCEEKFSAGILIGVGHFGFCSVFHFLPFPLTVIERGHFGFRAGVFSSVLCPQQLTKSRSISHSLLRNSELFR